MNVMIIGAAGRLGRELVKSTLADGHKVTAFIHNTPLDLQHPNLSIAQGDIMDSDSLNRPMAGQEAVICSIAIKQIPNEVEIYSEGTTNLIRCMTRHNARRLICITGVGVGESIGHGEPKFVKPIYDDKTRQEEIIRYCSRDWLVVRPARLTEGPARGRYAMLKEIRGVYATTISRADVANFCAAQLTSNKFLYQFPILTDE